MDHSRALRASVAPLPRDWNRRAGRPRLTWLRTVESDLAPFNIGLATAYHRAQNRQAWSKLVRTSTSSSGQATWWWWWWKVSSAHHTFVSQTQAYFYTALHWMQGDLVRKKCACLSVRLSVKRVNFDKMVGAGQPLLPEILDQPAAVGAKSPICNRYSLLTPQP